MSTNGQAEAEAIITKLGAEEGGLADDATPPLDWTGAETAYRLVSFMDPVNLTTGRGMGVGEMGQPYTLPFVVTFVGPTAKAVRDLSAATSDDLIDWAPNPPNSGAVKRYGGTKPYAVLDAQSVPTSWRKVSYYEVYIGNTVTL